MKKMNHIWRCHGQRKWLKTITMYSMVGSIAPLLVGGSLLHFHPHQGWALWDYELVFYRWAAVAGVAAVSVITGWYFAVIQGEVPDIDVPLATRINGATLAAFYLRSQKRVLAITLRILVPINRFMVLCSRYSNHDDLLYMSWLGCCGG